ncbi:hypothetical protein BDY24DRAFT_411962 [Mrakia frigida]|uniref:uncharacterized protein n=1 Tax=Mrakia frigida TaxID=29902 RepID=UPI003FCC015E
MSSLVPSIGSRRLPIFPLELKHHVLRFCDPSTLSKTSRLSLAFLQLSPPLLYRDIELVGLDKAELLFCSRDPGVSQPQLHPYLSIQHVHTFTIVATFQTGGELHLSTDRLPPPSTSIIFPSLPVDFLTLRPIGINPCDLVDQKEELLRWGSITRILDPTVVHVQGLPCSLFNPRQIPRLNLATSPP